MTHRHTPNEVITATCRSLRVDYLDLIGDGRMPGVVRARRAVVLLCRRYTTASFPEIAQAFHRRSHSIMVERERRAKKDLKEQVFAAEVARVEIALGEQPEVDPPQLEGAALLAAVEAEERRWAAQVELEAIA